MAGSLNPEATGASDDTGNVAFRPSGTGTANDGRKAPGVVLIGTDGNPYSASGGSGGGGAVTIADGGAVNIGTSTDTSTSTTVLGYLLKIAAKIPGLGQSTKSGSLPVTLASDQGAVTVSGTVTANVGTGTMATSVADGSNVTIGTTTDASTANTVIGRFQKLISLFPSGLGAKTSANSLAVVVASDQSSIPTAATIQGTPGVSQKGQTTVTDTLQSAVVANGNGTVSTTDGYNGGLILFIANGAGTATVTVQGSLDSGFSIAQDTAPVGLYKLSDSGAGLNTSRPIISNIISVAANTSYWFAIADSVPNVRAVVSAASGLGAGSSDTGLTVKLYKIPS